MALIPLRDKSHVQDSDYVYIPKNQALKYQTKLISEWKPKREVWSLKHGSVFIGTVCGVTSMVINGMFLAKLKLYGSNVIFSRLAALLGTGLLTTVTHESFITNSILLYERQCDLCLYLRAATITTIAGFVYPALVLPFLNVGMAGSLGLRIPPIHDIAQLAPFWWNVIQPRFNEIFALYSMGLLTAVGVTYKQALAMENIANILLRIEKYRMEHEEH